MRKINFIISCIVMIILTICTIDINNVNIFLLISLILVNLILLFRQLINIKTKDKITLEKNYNLLLLITNLMTIFLFLKSNISPFLPTYKEYEIDIYNSLFRNYFFYYNFKYLLIVYSCLLLYNLMSSKKLEK